MKKRLLIFLSRYRAPCLCLLSGLLLSLFAARRLKRQCLALGNSNES